MPLRYSPGRVVWSLVLVSALSWLPNLPRSLGAAPAAAAVSVRVSTTEQLQRAVTQAQPGTRILLAPGTYRGGLSFAQVRGRADAPIVLAAADEQRRPVVEGGPSGLHFSSPAYLELRHLVISGASGNGLNIDDGGVSDQPAHHVTLEGLEVRDIGPRGNRDGIKLSGLDHFAVIDCRVEQWGDSGSGIDMVGCHDGRIVDCFFRQRGDSPGNGVQTKGGSARIQIQRCRFEHAGGRAVNLGGSTGDDYFRPPAADCEARDITVEDCTFLGSQAAIAFVGADRAVVRYNTIYRPERWVVRILQESRGARFVPCRHGSFQHNLVVFHAAEIRAIVNAGDGTDPQSFQFADNWWFCADDPPRSSRLSLPVRETGATYGRDPQFVDAAQGDLRCRPNSPARNAGVRSAIPPRDSAP